MSKHLKSEVWQVCVKRCTHNALLLSALISSHQATFLNTNTGWAKLLHKLLHLPFELEKWFSGVLMDNQRNVQPFRRTLFQNEMSIFWNIESDFYTVDKLKKKILKFLIPKMRKSSGYFSDTTSLKINANLLWVITSIRWWNLSGLQD